MQSLQLLLGRKGIIQTENPVEIPDKMPDYKFLSLMANKNKMHTEEKLK